MCFDADARPPIKPMAGGAIESRALELIASDGNRFAAFVAEAPRPTGAGIIVLPDVRGLFGYYEELALRFAETGVHAVAIDYYGRTAGAARRDETFEFMPHTARTTWAGLRSDAMAAATYARDELGVSSLFSVGFCFGGRTSFLLGGAPDMAMAGVIGFYGWPVGPSRNDTPAPIDVVADLTAPVLGLFGGADTGIPTDAVGAYEAALDGAGAEHRIISYPGAPHSFFDRTQAAHAEASADAWREVGAFIAAKTVASGR